MRYFKTYKFMCSWCWNEKAIPKHFNGHSAVWNALGDSRILIPVAVSVVFSSMWSKHGSKNQWISDAWRHSHESGNFK